MRLCGRSDCYTQWRRSCGSNRLCRNYESSVAVVNLTQEQRIAKHKQFLSANWSLLAAFAWGYYQRQGRGAVVVDENDFVHADTPQFAALKFRYVADNSTMLKDIGGRPGDKEANWVKTYEPTQRIVVMIIRNGGGTSGYMIGGKPLPVECFDRQQAEKN